MTYPARKRLIRSFFHVAKALGLFHLSRRLTRDGIRFLGYHGFTISDEDRLIPGLFIDPKEFEQRLRYLAAGKFPVLPLKEAIERKDNGTLPECATVITIDDGFYSVRRNAAELLQRYGFPSTLYLTSFCFVRQVPFLNLAVDYICWKSSLTDVDLSVISIPVLQQVGELDVTEDDRRNIATIVKEFLRTQCEEQKQCDILRQLGEAFGVDYSSLAESRILSTVNAGEVREMLGMGMDVQLHTHGHDLPTDPDLANAAIEENRTAIATVTPDVRDHLAYPNGEWSPEHWTLLEKAGIKSAVTCKSGLVYRATPRYALNRIIDSSRVAQIEFEAEMSGFTELIRRIRGRSESRSAG